MICNNARYAEDVRAQRRGWRYGHEEKEKSYEYSVQDKKQIGIESLPELGTLAFVAKPFRLGFGSPRTLRLVGTYATAYGVLVLRTAGLQRAGISG